MSKKINLLIIDPQNDFVDQENASLPVPGAKKDMERLANLIDQIGKKIDAIHVTMDSHQVIDIAHPAWWVDKAGNPPAPFTIISAQDVREKIYTARKEQLRERSLRYVEALEQSGKYPLCIWPPHCLIGSWGHNIENTLQEALQRWSEQEFATVDYITKGSNPFTEHYGALMAEVVDPQDPSTSLNINFLSMLEESDMVLVAGEALSHCVKETVTQIADNIGEENLSKFYILTDCSSPVAGVPGGPDFPQIAKDWLSEMERRGMHISSSDEIKKLFV